MKEGKVSRKRSKAFFFSPHLQICLLIFREGAGEEKGRSSDETETLIYCLLYSHVQTGDGTHQPACALTGQQTCNLWCRQWRSSQGQGFLVGWFFDSNSETFSSK